MFWFSGMSLENIILGILVRLFIIFCILPLHEFAHAFASHKLGDNTAKWMGRMTLDPIKHVHPMGAVCLMLFGFGWARPVPVNPNYYKNRKVGLAIVSAAGPAANVVAAFAGMLVWRTLFAFNVDLPMLVSYVFMIFISINLSLAVFNLIPIPPLDGFDILALFLPNKAVAFLERNSQVLRFALLALIFFGSFTIIGTVSGALYDGLWFLVDGAFGLFGV